MSFHFSYLFFRYCFRFSGIQEGLRDCIAWSKNMFFAEIHSIPWWWQCISTRCSIFHANEESLAEWRNVTTRWPLPLGCSRLARELIIRLFGGSTNMNVVLWHRMQPTSVNCTNERVFFFSNFFFLCSCSVHTRTTMFVMCFLSSITHRHTGASIWNIFRDRIAYTIPIVIGWLDCWQYAIIILCNNATETASSYRPASNRSTDSRHGNACTVHTAQHTLDFINKSLHSLPQSPHSPRPLFAANPWHKCCLRIECIRWWCVVARLVCVCPLVWLLETYDYIKMCKSNRLSHELHAKADVYLKRKIVCDAAAAAALWMSHLHR